MIKIKSLFALLCFLTLSYGLYSQVPVEKSEKQVFILGKKYYLHEVKKGQTLYSISKTYEVSEHEIIAENAELVNGLKVGNEIKIPAIDGSQHSNLNTSEEFIYHKVEKKQTLYFLSNKYNISEAELVKLNPEISQGLRTGQLVKIPKQGSIPVDPDAKYKLHTVQPGETLFSLSQKYEIDINTLKIENPELNDQGPRIGQVLRIPLEKKPVEDVIKIEPQNASVSANLNYDPLYFEESGITPCNEFKYSENMQFKVGVLLPLYLQENALTKNSGKYYKNSGRFYEFYNGLLLAAKKLKEEGVSVEFFVKDTKASDNTVREILALPQMKEMDLIIGPVYSENFKLASTFAKDNKVNIIAPFKQKYGDLVVNNPYVFLASPSDETEVANICRYLVNSYDRSIVIIHNGTEDELKTVDLFRSKLASTFSANSNETQIVFKQVDYKTQGETALEDALSIGLENIVIIPSKDMVFITNLATKLNYLANKYKITAFGMYPWEQFESVEIEYLQNLKFHYGTTNYVNKEDEKVKVFDYQYKTYFKDEASIYSYLGYDVTYYFMNVLKDYGKHYQFCLGSAVNKKYKEGLRFDFNFERIDPSSGFENNWIRIIQIDKNLQMVRVK